MTHGRDVERRRSPRKRRHDCAWLVAARLRPGRDVHVLDLSSGGALIEASVRLMPGASFVLHLVGARSHHTVRGTVLRCYVAAIDRATGVRYRAALAFDQRFAAPDAETRREAGEAPEARVGGSHPHAARSAAHE